MPLDNIPDDALFAAANLRGNGVNRSSAIANGRPRSGMGDHKEPFAVNTRPATSMPRPPGPADFPVQPAPLVLPTDPNTTLGKLDILIALAQANLAIQQRILDELIRQNIAAMPVIRAVAVTSVGQTLDWASLGQFDRLMIINLGANDCWMSFDMNGPAVLAGTGNNSFKLTANMSVNLTHNGFDKIGLKTAGADTCTVQGIAWQTVAGNQAGAID